MQDDTALYGAKMMQPGMTAADSEENNLRPQHLEDYIGCKVKILDCEFNDELEYKIVGSTEANSLKGKISNESPVGRALLGKKVGDTITVETQAGELSYKVLEIQRSTVD